MSADMEICPHCGADPDGGSGSAGCYGRRPDQLGEIHCIFWCSNCRLTSAVVIGHPERIPVDEGVIRALPVYMREWLGRAVRGEFDPSADGQERYATWKESVTAQFDRPKPEWNRA